MAIYKLLLLFVAAAAALPKELSGEQPRALVPRKSAKLKGDGSPYQTYLYTQITSNMDCTGEGDAKCSTEGLDEKEYNIKYFAAVDKPKFTDGGFEVKKSVKTTGGGVCYDENTEGNRLCIWAVTAHTAYEVEDGKSSYYIYAPNERWGHFSLCATGDECVGLGARWWAPSTVPGGPQKFPFGGKNSWGKQECS